MGLDMYAYTTATTQLAATDFADPPGAQQIHEWRKHPDLHGWMQKLYVEKGGIADSFNCVNLTLTAHDLDRLEHAVRDRRLPKTTGFFFGESTGEELDDDLAFIETARVALAGGLAVYYSSWW